MHQNGARDLYRCAICGNCLQFTYSSSDHKVAEWATTHGRYRDNGTAVLLHCYANVGGGYFKVGLSQLEAAALHQNRGRTTLGFTGLS